MEIRKRLGVGDKIGLTAPAGPTDEGKLNKGIAVLKNLGFQVKVGLTCYQNEGGYLAGPAIMRANELNQMFADPNIDAIFCLRGGYGAMQILPFLDFDMIANHPKMLIGYSDITALHIALQQKSDLVTIHGPMPASDLISASDFTIQSLLSVLTNAHSSGRIENPPGEIMECLVPGKAEGILTGGNLALITSLLGTPFEINTKGKILFLEDVGEEPYRIDRMLTQLALAGKFDETEGILLGSWTDCQSSNLNSFQVKDVFRRIIAPFGKPTVMNVRAGHCEPAITLPFGVPVLLQAEEGKLSYFNPQSWL
ncbi:S66 peptidase family protein [Lederbergia ruris]|uniref:Peptidase S66 n=1 Tax=Lederbergia ruris TaxID=217495 RepID=A0ABQ4KEA4_9BACI|nr:LD-carboxypeptidase [Lederbergia ruris]GIN56298.1 peptidase S66 [Lederbergia ruris]